MRWMGTLVYTERSPKPVKAQMMADWDTANLYARNITSVASRGSLGRGTSAGAEKSLALFPLNRVVASVVWIEWTL